MKTPTRPEIDHRTSKLIVGIIALSLAGLTSVFAQPPGLTSISESYHHGGWSQAILIGFLYAIAAFLLSYNGLTPGEFVASKLAAVAALGVAMFPCHCGKHAVVPYVHGISAAVMFLVLTYFCYVFYKRALGKRHPEARNRAKLYAVCGWVLLLSVGMLAIDAWLHTFTALWPAFMFYGETAALIAFGVSWLTASKVFPFLADEAERLQLSPSAPSTPQS